MGNTLVGARTYASLHPQTAIFDFVLAAFAVLISMNETALLNYLWAHMGESLRARFGKLRFDNPLRWVLMFMFMFVLAIIGIYNVNVFDFRTGSLAEYRNGSIDGPWSRYAPVQIPAYIYKLGCLCLTCFIGHVYLDKYSLYHLFFAGKELKTVGIFIVTVIIYLIDKVADWFSFISPFAVIWGLWNWNRLAGFEDWNLAGFAMAVCVFFIFMALRFLWAILIHNWLLPVMRGDMSGCSWISNRVNTWTICRFMLPRVCFMAWVMLILSIIGLVELWASQFSDGELTGFWVSLALFTVLPIGIGLIFMFIWLVRMAKNWSVFGTSEMVTAKAFGMYDDADEAWEKYIAHELGKPDSENFAVLKEEV